ncbi:hypothetical protein LTR56_011692 [Elasticomyces elasticus]|nr:hypothetical protein LTR56_011692 [Elasticomyces elasticus]KAK3658521.1 hypothetical protein LTR22_008874 [Elasticomyces elasticus]KAK4921169.1 hypothetical protein LTR49_011356 [Elasticomyces elasticus]KAK5761886.1 hypothetical protein LTS12_007949 [Elasticomyces elasticus]
METVSSTDYYKTGGVEYYIPRGKSTTGETIATIDNCLAGYTDCARHCNAYKDCGAWTWTPSGVCDLKAGKQSLAPNLNGTHYAAGLKGDGNGNASYTTTTNTTTGASMTVVTTHTSTIALTGSNSTAIPAGPGLATSIIYCEVLILLVFSRWWAICCVVAAASRAADRNYVQEFMHQGRGALPTHPEMQDFHTKLKECAEIYEPAAAEGRQLYAAYKTAHMRLSRSNEAGIGPSPRRYEGPKAPYDYQKVLLPESQPELSVRSTSEGYTSTTAGFALFFTVFTCVTTIFNDSGECFDVVLMRHFLWMAVPVIAVIMLPSLYWLFRGVNKLQPAATKDTMIEKGAIEHDGRENSTVKDREDEWEAVRRIS